MKNEQKTLQSTKKRSFDLSKRTVYCLFKSKKTFNIFQTQIKQKRIKSRQQTLFKTQISEIHLQKERQSKTEQTNDCDIYKIGLFSKQFKCIKCERIQSTFQEVNNICSQCHYLQKLVKSGNLEKFVLFVLDFKTQQTQSLPSSRSKIKRIESIESCQSLIVDKGDDNKSSHHNHNHRHHYRKSINTSNNFPHVKQSTKFVNSLDIDRHFEKGHDHMLSASGSTSKLEYYCNECQAVPIVGRRFHCLTCEDFDLCEICYFYVGHKHEMKTFDDQKLTSAKQVHLQVIKRNQKLKNTLNYLSSSIRSFQTKTKLYKTTNLKQTTKKH